MIKSKLTDDEIKNNLTELLKECLETANQDGGIKSVSFDRENEEFTVVFNVFEVEEDDYIAFEGY